MKDTELLGKKIRQLRLSNDLSLRDLAAKSKVSFSFISSIEKNRYNASRETIIALADALEGSNKNELLLLAGFAPEENDPSPNITQQKESEVESDFSIAFLGGGKEVLDEEEAEHLERELEMFRAFREKRRRDREQQDK